jgi:poly-gamma-glutamate capsule biosynthesis protein CapA/YwtB (metallophosphatase superfamily)
VKSISCAFCGDTMLRGTTSGVSPFEEVRHLLSNTEVAFCNLETVLSDSGEKKFKRHSIKSDPANVNLLKGGGFNVVNVANNHMLDFGQEGCINTIDNLRESGIGIVGLRGEQGAAPVVMNSGGRKAGILGYADYGFRNTLMPLREGIAIEDVKRLKRSVDIVIVSLHWGYEYVEYPSPAQQSFARRIIREGALLVVGHHPHVVQGIEEYKGGLIAYSLGNFQFRIDEAENLRRRNSGIILRVSISDKEVANYEVFRVETDRLLGVRLQTEQEATKEKRTLRELSDTVRKRKVGKRLWLKEACRIYFPMQLETWRFRIAKKGNKEKVQMLRWLLQPDNLMMLFVYLWGCFRGAGR